MAPQPSTVAAKIQDLGFEFTVSVERGPEIARQPTLNVDLSPGSGVDVLDVDEDANDMSVGRKLKFVVYVKPKRSQAKLPPYKVHFRLGWMARTAPNVSMSGSRGTVFQDTRHGSYVETDAQAGLFTRAHWEHEYYKSYGPEQIAPGAKLTADVPYETFYDEDWQKQALEQTGWELVFVRVVKIIVENKDIGDIQIPSGKITLDWNQNDWDDAKYLWHPDVDVKIGGDAQPPANQNDIASVLKKLFQFELQFDGSSGESSMVKWLSNLASQEMSELFGVPISMGEKQKLDGWAKMVTSMLSYWAINPLSSRAGELLKGERKFGNPSQTPSNWVRDRATAESVAHNHIQQLDVAQRFFLRKESELNAMHPSDPGYETAQQGYFQARSIRDAKKAQVVEKVSRYNSKNAALSGEVGATPTGLAVGGGFSGSLEASFPIPGTGIPWVAGLVVTMQATFGINGKLKIKLFPDQSELTGLGAGVPGIWGLIGQDRPRVTQWRRGYDGAEIGASLAAAALIEASALGGKLKIGVGIEPKIELKWDAADLDKVMIQGTLTAPFARFKVGFWIFKVTIRINLVIFEPPALKFESGNLAVANLNGWKIFLLGFQVV